MSGRNRPDDEPFAGEQRGAGFDANLNAGRAEQDLGNVKCVQGNERIGRDNRPRL